jgi:hypothetical protein
VNANKLVAGLRRAERRAGVFFGKLAKHRQKLRNSSIALGAAFAGQLFLMKKVTDAAARQEAEERRLEDALANVAVARENDAEMLKLQAKELANHTKFADEAILSAQSMLATFQLGGDQIAEATKRVLDMAAATEKMTGTQVDLQQVAIAVGKGLTGQVGILSRYGVVLSDEAKKSKDFNVILGELDKNFKGIAEGSAKTFAGRQEQMKNVIGDLAEEIGFTLFPILTRMMQTITPIIIRTAEWVRENQKLVAVLIGIGVGGTGLLAGLSTFGFMLSGIPLLVSIAGGSVGILALAFITLATAIGVALATANKMPDSVEAMNEELAENEKRLKKLREIQGKTTESQRQLNFEIDKGPPGMTQQNTAAGALSGQIAALEKRNKELTEASTKLEASQKREAETAQFLADMQQRLNDQKNQVDSEAFMKELRERVSLREKEAALGEQTLAAAEKPLITEEMLNALETYNNGLDQAMELLEELPLTHSQAASQLLDDIHRMSTGFSLTFVNMFDTLVASGKNFLKSLGAAFVASFLRMIRMAIEAAIIQVLIAKVEESAKAIIKAPLTFGASLLALAPIAAAAAAGIAGLRALEGKFAAKQGLRTGGIARGGEEVHPREIVFNAASQDLGDFFSMLRMVAPGMAADANMGGNIEVNIGSVSNDLDVNDMLRKVAETVRYAKEGGI